MRKVVKRRKEDAQAWLHLGIALSRAGKDKDARKAFEKVTKLLPEKAEPHIGMAYLFISAGKLSEAEREALRAIALNASNAEAHYALGLIALRQNAHAKALEEAEATLKLNPRFASALLLKTEAAVELYVAASAETSEKYHALNQSAPAISPVERAEINKLLKEAAESVETYLKLSPSSPDAARLQEQAETLRQQSVAVSQSDVPFVYTFSEVTTKAQILSKPEPSFTEQARNKGITGTVQLRVLLSFDGRVRHILVTKGLGGGLTETAVEAARKIKFSPAIKDGRRVSQFVTIEYSFNIY